MGKYGIRKNIVLVGFMGAGKTSVSKRLSELTYLPEAETDAMIVEREGMPITEIFEKRGEEYFRDAETEVIRSLAGKGPMIVSCGGGAVLREENTGALKQAGTVILLTASPETTLERVKRTGGRPILEGHMDTEYIAMLQEKRRAAYEAAADITIATDGKTLDKIAWEILSRLMDRDEEDSGEKSGEAEPGDAAKGSGKAGGNGPAGGGSAAAAGGSAEGKNVTKAGDGCASAPDAPGITGHTGMYCLIGSPVSHSGSPAMYNYSFRKLGIDSVYLAFDVKLEDTADVIGAFRRMGCRGFNITMPGKTAALSCMDELSEAARLIGAVNTVVNRDGRLIGHNTDGYGWVESVRRGGFEIRGKKMTICGAGGAATAIQITSALEGLGEMSIFVRTKSLNGNAARTVEKLREHVPGIKVGLYDLSDRDRFYKEIAESDIFTNATSVGMKPDEDATLIDRAEAFRKDLTVSDVVYEPRETRLIREARAAGCRVIPGIGMLLWQGAAAFRLYTGREMPAKEVEERYFR